MHKKGEQSDGNNFLYDDVTPTPKKATKARKTVRKSQISGPILHNSSVSSCTTRHTVVPSVTNLMPVHTFNFIYSLNEINIR